MGVERCALVSIGRDVHTGGERLGSEPTGWETIMFVIGEEREADMLQSFTLGKPTKCVYVGVTVFLWVRGCFHRRMNADIV